MDPEIMTATQAFMAENMWAVYIGLFLGPFVQEDAAVISAASLAAAGMSGPAPAILLVALAGLSASDLWKYWIGAAARSQAWAARFAEGPRIKAAGELVNKQLGKTLFAARFLPGTRIALYIAAGYFRVDFRRFAFFIVATAAFLIVSLYLVLKVLGDLIGDRAILVVSVTAVCALLLYFAVKIVRAQLAKRQSAAEMGREEG